MTNRRVLLGWLGLILAAGFLVTVNLRRIERVAYVSALAGGADADKHADAGPSTGSVGGPRQLLVPERHEPSYAWIAGAEQMLVRGEWRARQTGRENAPVGRAVFDASAYRWWLALAASIDRAVSGRPIARAVEHAAIVVEPILHLVLLLAFTGFCAWRFGAFAAAGFAVACVALFPLAASFLPGVPDDRGLALACAFGSLLPLVVGVHESSRANRWFVLSGICGGLGLWIDVATQIPVLAGSVIGGGLAQWVSRRGGAAADARVSAGRAWRVWALAGAATALAAYLLEYAPAHLGHWELRANHPLYALAWLGAGELLARTSHGSAATRGRGWGLAAAALVLATAMIAALPLAMHLTGSRAFLATELDSFRLTNLPGSIVAANSGAWIRHEGTSLTVWATLLPLAIAAAIAWQLARNRVAATWRAALAFTVGPMVVAGGFAWQWLSAWAVADCALVVGLVTAMAADSRRTFWPRSVSWGGLIGMIAIPGAIALWPDRAGPEMPLTRAEAELLIERDLGHWLLARAGQPGAIVYAPPQVTAALTYFGGFRGIGTFASGNEVGFGLTLAIAGARTMEEVQWALQTRGVRYVVVPSWDPFFDEFARLHLVKEHANRVSFFVSELRRWHLPAWLRPIAYQPPAIPGLEHAAALVFEVMEEQSPGVAASRLAEFFVETGRLAEAAEIETALRRFPGDLSALTARAQIQSAREDSAGFAQTMDALQTRLTHQADRYLAWDRRVSLAAILAQAQRMELAKTQVRRCLSEADDQKLRALSEGALFRLLVLSDAFELPFAEPQLRSLGESLLSPGVRSQL